MIGIIDEREAGATELPYVLAENEHGRYCIPRSSIHCASARKVLDGEVWERGTLEFIAANCGDGDVVTAGLYFGDFLPALSKSVATGAVVWGFEPGSENFRCATETARLNGLTSPQLFNAALGKDVGRALLRIREGAAPLGGTCRIEPDSLVEECEEVAVTTIDATVPEGRRVSIIHIDAEGSEHLAIAGGWRTIRRNWPVLIIECNQPLRVLRALLPHYDLKTVINANMVFFPKAIRLR